MKEEPKFPGLWICPDGRVRINESPPYRFKCAGVELTEEGTEALQKEIWKQYAQRN